MNAGAVVEEDGVLTALVQVRVLGTNGLYSDVQAILDTGFTDALTLPTAQIAALALPFQELGPMTMADGRLEETATYLGTVEWGAGQREVLIAAVDSEPLLGMEMLRGHVITLQAAENGSVEVAPLTYP